ncbi:cell division protein FtsB [Ereboglobus sp. PH5-10]|uniref:hypothetical protein n=1 Tax=Ereboglobus sp. PH5-10 TaxID=2940629 RepID=UPI0024076D1C|nr:hypothetical protein [Ereboglobus sp. PH5-10]MDF9828341.1 cell division protein FtsB [Ereboglobus sp. PH5-10]
MSNEPTQMTQFQQKAQLRLQEMEVEWRRTLFERFRTICREEMMEVVKALLESMHNPQDLEQKISEMQERANTNQMELFTTVTQTSEEVRNLAKKLEQPQASDPQVLETITKGQEAISKEVTTKQDETTRIIQEDVRQSAQLSRSTLWKAVAITAVACILLCAGAVASLRLLSGSSLVSQADLKARDTALTQKAAAQAEVKALEAEKAKGAEEVKRLTAQSEALKAEIRQTTATQSSLAANLSAMQQQVTQLQQIQEQFRFKLVKGEAGGVFVEVPPEAQTFQYMDRTFIQVK